jgi:hypothetical protein
MAFKVRGVNFASHRLKVSRRVPDNSRSPPLSVLILSFIDYGALFQPCPLLAHLASCES